METATVKYGDKEFTVDQLKTAFERVQNRDHWKGPIDCIIPSSDIIITAAAIEFYTATKADIAQVDGTKSVRITAPGYWAGPAA